jgi:hypothetical protein
MKGIFSPQSAQFPLADIILTLLASAITMAAVWRAIALNPLSYVWLFAGVAFGSVTLAFGLRTYGKLVRYLKTRSLARRIAMEEEG